MQFVKWTWGIKEHDPCQERMVQMTAVKELFWQRLQLQCYDDNQEEEARLLTLVYRSSSKTLFLCSSGQMEEISLIMEKEIWEPSDVGDNASSLRSNTDVEVELVQLWQGGCGTKEGGWEVCLFGESFWISVQTQFLCAGWLKASWNLNQTTAFTCFWCLTCQEADPMRSMALTDKETCIRMQGKVFSSIHVQHDMHAWRRFNNCCPHYQATHATLQQQVFSKTKRLNSLKHTTKTLQQRLDELKTEHERLKQQRSSEAEEDAVVATAPICQRLTGLRKLMPHGVSSPQTLRRLENRLETPRLKLRLAQSIMASTQKLINHFQVSAAQTLTHLKTQSDENSIFNTFLWHLCHDRGQTLKTAFLSFSLLKLWTGAGIWI